MFNFDGVTFQLKFIGNLKYFYVHFAEQLLITVKFLNVSDIYNNFCEWEIEES